MISRKEALALIEEHVQNRNIIKHMFALEAVMEGIWEELKKRGKGREELAGSKEEWMMAGLLHDGDYTEAVPMEKQGIEITNWAKDAGYEIPQNVAHAMAAHNWANTKVEPKNLMDWAIFTSDSLTGLIVASTLVLPSKKLAELSVPSILKKFKSPSFAKGTRRDDISLCDEKLGIKLEDFIKIALNSMQAISQELGL